MKYVVFEPTKPEAVEFIKDLIQDKVVYDLGAGNGSFGLAMKPYAKRVVAVEIDQLLASDCRYRNLETIQENFMKVSVSEAEVIFLFLNLIGTYAITKKLQEENWHGTVISHYYPLQNSLDDLIKPDKVIDVVVDGDRFPFLIYNIISKGTPGGASGAGGSLGYIK